MRELLATKSKESAQRTPNVVQWVHAKKRSFGCSHEGEKDIARERKRRTANKADAASGSSKVPALAEDTRLRAWLAFRLAVYHMGHLGDADRCNTQGSGPFPRASHATAVPMTG